MVIYPVISPVQASYYDSMGLSSNAKYAVARTPGSVGSSYYSETVRLQLHRRSDCNRATLRPPGPNYLSAGCKWHRLLLRVNHRRRAAKRALRFSATAGIENAEAALGHFEIRSRIATSDIARIFLLLLTV